jgi:MFS family permease
MRSVKNNIKLNYGFEFISNLNFTQVLWVSYLAFKGLTLVEIGLCESVFHIASLVFEVPTGLIADRFGRKLSRMLAVISRMIYLVLLLFVNNFGLALFSFVFAALSYNLESGADSAFVYDSMVETGTQAGFARVQGYREVIFQFSGLIAVMVGGLLADIRYEYAIFATMGILALGLFIATFLKEPLVKETQEKTTIRSLIQTAVQTIKQQPTLGWLMLYGALFQGVSATFYFYLSTYLRNQGYSLSAIAIWYMINTFGSILAGLSVNRLINRYDNRLIFISSLLMTASLLFMPLMPWGMIAFFINGLSESILYVTMTHHINRKIRSETRATLLSVNAMAYSVIMAVLFPVFGYFGDQVGLWNAFITVSIIMIIFVILFILWLRKATLTGSGFFDIISKN